jgi:uncharacterized membrane protein
MLEMLTLTMRWLHITSVALIIGGMLYAWLVIVPGAELLAADARSKLAVQSTARFRPLLVAAMGALLVSGIYNILITPGHTPRYHMLLGIKLLLALHVFATSFLLVQKHDDKGKRRMASIAIAGMVIILISAYLRRIF